MLMLINYKMSDAGPLWDMVEASEVAQIVKSGAKNVIIIDSRSFLEYNTCNIQRAINISCSKLVKRRLEHDKVTVLELLSQSCGEINIDTNQQVIVYDQCTEVPVSLSNDCFLVTIMKKLKAVFKTVQLLKGGFLEFQAYSPMLCETRSVVGSKYSSMTSMSQPCLPVSNIGPTKILPFLYLGSQKDSVSQEDIKMNGVTYILNVSTSCPKPPFIPEGHFLRIPVNDNYNDKLLPYFIEAFQYIDKVREANGCVLIHCLAGISRSPTLAIAYIMRYLKISSDEAYRYVKEKRPTISPNFNFLGQLLEYEKVLLRERGETPTLSDRPTLMSSHRSSFSSLDSPSAEFLECIPWRSHKSHEGKVVQSPTTALAKLNFSQCASSTNSTSTYEIPSSFPTTSLDKLSFTPCLTSEESLAMDKARTTGTKRPLSFSSVESKSTRLRKDFFNSLTQREEKMESENSVTLRSPEIRAKRPLVRPNTIAFSSYPVFELDGKHCSGIASFVNERTILTPCQEHLSPSNDWPQVSNTNTTLSSAGCSPDINQISAIQPIANARKSRSLDDILVSSNSAPRVNKSNTSLTQDKKLKQCGITSADIFGKNVDLESVHRNRCAGNTDVHQSNSSISSTGSHGSVHGSLEMIPVS